LTGGSGLTRSDTRVAIRNWRPKQSKCGDQRRGFISVGYLSARQPIVLELELVLELGFVVEASTVRPVLRFHAASQRNKENKNPAGALNVQLVAAQ